MSERPWYEQYVVSDPETLSGTPVLAGTRLPASVVAASVAHGMTIDQVVAAFPSINAVQAEAAVAFIRDNPGPHTPDKEPFWRSGKLKFSVIVPYSKAKKRQ